MNLTGQLLAVLLISYGICLVFGDVTTPKQASSTASPTGNGSLTTPIPPTVDPKEYCAQYNNRCDECVAHHQDDPNPAGCFYCHSKKACFPCASVAKCLIGTETECDIGDSYQKQCYVDEKTAIIVVASIAGGLLLLLGICVAVCCHKRSKAKIEREWRKWQRQREARKAQSEASRAVREAKNAEIRAKYGIGGTTSRTTLEEEGENNFNRYKRF